MAIPIQVGRPCGRECSPPSSLVVLVMLAPGSGRCLAVEAIVTYSLVPSSPSPVTHPSPLPHLTADAGGATPVKAAF